MFRIGRALEIYFCANVMFMDMLLPPLLLSICLECHENVKVVVE